jgi:3-mercaptopyruvate sulfurtransferase SseA
MKTESMKHFTVILLFVMICAGATSARAARTGSLVEPVQLKQWIDAGYRTEGGERVVIIDVVPGSREKDTWFAGSAETLKRTTAQKHGERSPQYRLIDELDRKGAMGHIPGAFVIISHAGLEVADRSEGPVETEHQVGTGAGIDNLLRDHGITFNDVIVITSAQQNPWMVCGPRLWWTLYYWGFSPEKIKLLNGGNKGYALAGYPLQKGVNEPAVTPSTMSVADFPSHRFEVRVSLDEMISLVDGGDTSNGKVFLLDNRQPSATYYLEDVALGDGKPGADGIPDLFQVPGYRYDPQTKLFTRDGDKSLFTVSEMLFGKGTAGGESPRARFNPVVHPPIPLPNPFVAVHSVPSPSRNAPASPLSIPVGIKPADFEGMIKGAHLVKTAAYDITVPALVGPDNRFKSKEDLLALFAKAGIDGSKAVILYCNTGALSSFYFYALHEICGFRNVRIYDGSWMEWSILTAFEPVDATYVRRDIGMLYPAYPAMAPALPFFYGRNNYLEWDGKGLVDAASGASATPDQVKPGGSLNGKLRWDTVHRSEHVVFRPSEKVNDPKRYRTFNSDIDWPPVDTITDYEGKADRISAEDNAYSKNKDITAVRLRSE